MRDVIVVGAGPAGSCAAAALAQHGWDVLLLEKDRFPRHKVCGEFLSPESQSSLTRFDLLTAIDSLHPHPIWKARLVGSRGAELTVPLPGRARGVSRFAMDAALANAAVKRGANLRQGCRVIGSERNRDGYKVAISGSEPVRSRMLLFACGRHSTASLPPHAPLPDRRRRYIGAKMHYTGLTPNFDVELYFFPGGYCGINHVEGESANVCLLCRYDAFTSSAGCVNAIIQGAAASNPALARRLAEGKPLNESASAVASVDVYRAPAAWADDAPTLGDTAAMIPPLCGDGMAMALRSAEICASLVDDFLRGHLDSEMLQLHYSTQWRQEFEGRLRVGRWLQKLLSQGTLTEVALRIGGHIPYLSSYLVHATRGAMP